MFGQIEEDSSVVATRIDHLCVLIADSNGDSMGKSNAESPKNVISLHNKPWKKLCDARYSKCLR